MIKQWIPKKKWTYGFGEFESVKSRLFSEGKDPRNILGGKGFGLMEMTHLGLPVPQGIIVTTEVCKRYLEKEEQLDNEIWGQIKEALLMLESETGKKLGDPRNPLLVSCRSGARTSMPGMMDTVLNIGLNDEVVGGLKETLSDPAFVYNSYRRLIQMFGSVVMKIDDELFEDILSEIRQDAGVLTDTELTTEHWQSICQSFENIYKQETKQLFPKDPLEQIRMAIEAVFKSWNSKRAIVYRNATGIPHHWGTAVNIVTMVFGNRDDQSATGVCFTRNPDSGKKCHYGDFLVNAQGEDVVAGIRNTLPINQLKDSFPRLFPLFNRICDRLEDHYKDMQDLEFTVEQGKLWILQTRSGKRTPQAALKIAVDMANEGSISRQEAILRVTPNQIDSLLHPGFRPLSKAKAVENGDAFTRGINASPGAAVGAIVFDADSAESWSKEGKSVIMVRLFTKPDDIHGMIAAQGILTAEGGATSHAAVVARQFGIPCIVGAKNLRINLDAKELRSNGVCIREGDIISIDGTTGECFLGSIPMVQPDIANQTDLKELLSWADQERCLQVWANADNTDDALRAIQLGAEGIGLCRTEHMFFQSDRLPIVQKMILTVNKSEKDSCLSSLLKFQKKDFVELFRAMNGRPIVIRLIDPPLHEFIPDKDSVIQEVYDLKKAGNTAALTEKSGLLKSIEALHESNPMMGMRGVRLSIIMNDIVTMQVRAIFEAACKVVEEGIPVQPEIMIPFVAHLNELKVIQPQLEVVARKVMERSGITVNYLFGSIIELPRACVSADEIAQLADFLSFGTNDLTQMTFGFSRDDVEASFLVEYLKRGILPSNPFQTLDVSGVGALIKEAIRLSRKTKPTIQIGVCGEHGGDPESIHFFHNSGLDYVSCSPLRIPIARLAAAQANLQDHVRVK